MSTDKEQTPQHDNPKPRSTYEIVTEREHAINLRKLDLAARQLDIQERELEQKTQHNGSAHQEWRDHVARVEARYERLDREHAEHIAEWKAHVQEWRAECVREREQLDAIVSLLRHIAL